MTERTEQHSTEKTRAARRASGPPDQETAERRELLVLEAGPRVVGVFTDEAYAPVEWKEPTPLPRAPRAILGVVSVRGRMFTVLDVPALFADSGKLDEEVAGAHPARGLIVPLRGDEQLALAVGQTTRAMEIQTDGIGQPADVTGSSILRGVVAGQHQEQILLLNPSELFAAAMRGSERRRRRF